MRDRNRGESVQQPRQRCCIRLFSRGLFALGRQRRGGGCPRPICEKSIAQDGEQIDEEYLPFHQPVAATLRREHLRIPETPRRRRRDAE